jgi:hypothetical protein
MLACASQWASGGWRRGTDADWRFVRNPDVCLDREIKQTLAILGKLAKLDPVVSRPGAARDIAAAQVRGALPKTLEGKPEP